MLLKCCNMIKLAGARQKIFSVDMHKSLSKLSIKESIKNIYAAIEYRWDVTLVNMGKLR